MKLMGRMHLSLLVLALLNMLPTAEVEASWSLFGIAGASALLSCVYFGWTGGRRLPRLVIYSWLLCSLGFLLWEMFYPHEDKTVYIIDLAHFILLLCCCKFFELHTYRDAGLVALISFLLMVISSFVSASPLFGAVAIVDITFGIAWLIAFNARRESDAVMTRRRAALAAATSPIPAAPVDAPETSQPGLIRSTAAFSLALAAIASIVFVSIPRDWEGLFLGRLRGLAGSSMTGMSDVVKLTDNEIFEDDTTVMRARFFRNGEPVTDDTFQAYLRNQTFDQYLDGEWKRRPMKFRWEFRTNASDGPTDLFEAVNELSRENMVRQEIWLLSPTSPVLLSMYPPLSFESGDIKGLHLDRKDLVFQANSGFKKKIHYSVYSSEERTPALARQLRLRPYRPRDDWSRIPPRVLEFAQSFAAAVGDPTDPWQHEYIARRVRDYLASDQFQYTLNRGASMQSGDLVENFLFENPRGHCEYFASAMAVMCQAVGIRARLVNGYHGGEYNSVGGFFQFRQSDAHAWVEVYVPDRGWITMDPTPATAVDAGAADESFFASSLRFLNYLQFKWSAEVVTFDSDNRQNVMSGFSDWFARLTQSDSKPRTVLGTVKVMLWGPDLPALWMRLLYWFILALCVVLLIVGMRVAWILSLMVREYLPGPRHRQVGPIRRAEARFYDRLLLLLRYKGHAKSAQTTPREFARALARSHTDLAGVPEFTEWYYDVQYGRKPLGAQRKDRVRTFLQRLREDHSFGTK